MSTEFNYKRAWRDLKPLYEALPEEMKELYRKVQKAGADIKQVKGHCETLTGVPDELRQAFTEADIADLSKSMHTIYNLGHWDYRDTALSPEGWQRDNYGCYWKFRMLAKETLIKRGFRDWDKYETIGTDSYMDHKEGTEFDNGELPALLKPVLVEFEVLSVDNINYKPHPFMIGSQYLTNSKGMYLDFNRAPCAMRGCNLSYAEHTSDRVVFLKRRPDRQETDENKLAQVEIDNLESVKPLMKKHKLDGFVFVK